MADWVAKEFEKVKHMLTPKELALAPPLPPEKDLVQSTPSRPRKPRPRVRGPYMHHDPVNAENMGRTALRKGWNPKRVSENSFLWGYDQQCCPVDTIRVWAKKAKQVEDGEMDVEPTERQPHPHDIPVAVKRTVAQQLEEHGDALGETTTDVGLGFFQNLGFGVSKSFLSGFLRDDGFGLYKPIARTLSEVKNPEKAERTAQALWRALESARNEGLELEQILTFDEKPLVEETHSRKVIRKKGVRFIEQPAKPPLVLGCGRTRARVTGVFPALAAPNPNNNSHKFPLVVMFKGKNQLPVTVHPDMPVLVVFTESAMMNSDAFNYIVHNAMLPNLKGKCVVVCDDHGSHFSDTTLAYAQDWTTPTASLYGLCLKHPLTK
jgi:hypothetical protein